MANRFLNSITVDGKIYYSNVFQALTDLPSATDYHGMFAHVHNEGAAYYAHAGNWVKLANYSDISGSANDSTLTITAGTALSGGGTFTTNQSSDSAVTVNLDNTAVTPGTYGDANNTPQIIIDQQGRITSATTVSTAGSGGGGGGGSSSLSIEKNVFTATANQTAFTISSSITSSSNTQVYIDGVYQAKSNYTTSGSVITFSSGVPLGAEVEVIHFIAVASKVYTDSFTGDGSDVTFDASKDVTDENITQIYIDGVYQSKDNYTTSGATITFSTAPPNGSAIEVVHFESINYSSLASNQFTGTGSQTAFTLTQSVDVDTSFVFIQGVYQEKDQYSISGTTLTFTSAPLNGYSIEVVTVGAVANVSVSPVTSVNGLTGAVTVSGGTDWKSTIKTADFTAVASEGYFVNTTSSAITVTLPSSPTAGDEVSIVDYAGTADTNKIVITSSDNINGLSDDVIINYERGGVSMVYVDATQGWIAYNATNETTTALAVDSSFSVDYLVVAGGGAGGGNYRAGGGGAGGLRTSYGNNSGGGNSAESSFSALTSTNYTIEVGASGAASNNAQGGNGGDSKFGTVGSEITSTGGGGGSPYGTAAGSAGGSGGGSAGLEPNMGSAGAGGAGQVGTQGYNGGQGASSSSLTGGGGGGGAGAQGNNYGSGATDGDGGVGLEVNIIGSTGNFYAGGGGGGNYGSQYGNVTVGGNGGGGAGGSALGTDSGVAGTVNKGGGGGGSAWTGVGSAGGSGVVILRYPDTYTIQETTSGGNVLTFTTDSTTVANTKITTFTAGTSGTIQFS